MLIPLKSSSTVIEASAPDQILLARTSAGRNKLEKIALEVNRAYMAAKESASKEGIRVPSKQPTALVLGRAPGAITGTLNTLGWATVGVDPVYHSSTTTAMLQGRAEDVTLDMLMQTLQSVDVVISDIMVCNERGQPDPATSSGLTTIMSSRIGAQFPRAIQILKHTVNPGETGQEMLLCTQEVQRLEAVYIIPSRLWWHYADGCRLHRWSSKMEISALRIKDRSHSPILSGPQKALHQPHKAGFRHKGSRNPTAPNHSTSTKNYGVSKNIS